MSPIPSAGGKARVPTCVDSPWAASGGPGWRAGDLISLHPHPSAVLESGAGQQPVDSSPRRCGLCQRTQTSNLRKEVPSCLVALTMARGTMVNYASAILGHRWGLGGARSQLSARVPASQVPGCPPHAHPVPGMRVWLPGAAPDPCAVILVCVSILGSWGTRQTLRSLYRVLSTKLGPSGPREGRGLRSTEPDR